MGMGDYPPPKENEQHVFAPWKSMVGRWTSPFWWLKKRLILQGRTVSFREGTFLILSVILSWRIQNDFSLIQHHDT